jgi:DNA-binding MarR family transcriptional regulator
MKNLLKLKHLTPIDKLVILTIEDNTYWGVAEMTSQAIATAIGSTRKNVLKSLISLEEIGYIQSSVDGEHRSRKIIILKELLEIINDFAITFN